MCLVIASPSGKGISKEILQDAAGTNRDGAGLAWLDNGKIQFRKGLTVDELQVLLENEAKDKVWVSHFRIATVGGVTPKLTHPFTIDERASIELSGEADSVLFQNGTFNTWKEYLLQASAAGKLKIPEPPWSDTRAVAFLCHVYGKHLLSLLDNHSRFLVFDAKEPKEKRIMLWGSWEDHDGFKFSNKGSCAFHVSKTYSPGRGGGSENPTKAAQANDADAAESEMDEGTAADRVAEMVAAQTDSPSQSKVSLVPSREKKAPTFRQRRSHNVWRQFTQAGLLIKGDNEPSTSAQ